MAGESRGETDRLKAVLNLVQRQGGGHFRAIVALLERATPGRARIGGDGPVADEGIRFRNDPSLSFAPSDVSSVELTEPPPKQAGADGGVFEVVTTFLGLTGAVSPLPSYLAEQVAQEPPTEPALRDFYDIFHHRFLSLLYRGIIRYGFAREFAADCGDAWSKRVLAFIGFDAYERPPASALPPWQILRLAPLLGVRRPTHWAIEAALADVLTTSLAGAPVHVQPFVGSWVPIDVAEQTRLGTTNSRLGVDLVLGRAAFDRTGKFRVVVGPCSREVFYRFRNDPVVHALVVETVKLFCRDPLEVDLGIILAAREIDGWRLGSGSRQRLAVDVFLGVQAERQIVVPLTPHHGPDTPSLLAHALRSEDTAARQPGGARGG